MQGLELFCGRKALRSKQGLWCMSDLYIGLSGSVGKNISDYLALPRTEQLIKIQIKKYGRKNILFYQEKVNGKEAVYTTDFFLLDYAMWLCPKIHANVLDGYLAYQRLLKQQANQLLNLNGHQDRLRLMSDKEEASLTENIDKKKREIIWLRKELQNYKLTQNTPRGRKFRRRVLGVLNRKYKLNKALMENIDDFMNSKGGYEDMLDRLNYLYLFEKFKLLKSQVYLEAVMKKSKLTIDECMFGFKGKLPNYRKVMERKAHIFDFSSLFGIRYKQRSKK